MQWISELTEQIDKLIELSSQVIEEHFRLTIQGNEITQDVLERLKSIHEICTANSLAQPIILSRDEQISDSDLDSLDMLSGDDWRLILGKEKISEYCKLRDNETSVVFFYLPEFINWLDRLDPLEKADNLAPDLNEPTTFRINGLNKPFGGSLLWFLPLDGQSPTQVQSKLPETIEVHHLIHVISNKVINISPKSYELSWGDFDSALAKKVLALGVKVYASSLVQDLQFIDGEYKVTLNGTKRLVLPLTSGSDVVTEEFVAVLKETVEWVYSEKPETRLKLVMDRLSIDILPQKSLISGMNESLSAALQQAKDSYAFVILERKDAYHKEMRDLMKDMKSQSEIYASKVRDLVGSLTRDILGILVFIGFSFIGKFDETKINDLLSSDELSLLTKFLSGYLLLSCALQLMTHWRDSSLTFDESKKWLSVLKNYTSLEDSRLSFIQPLEKRRCTLHIAMACSGLFYLLLIIVTWHLPFLIKLLLQQS